MFAMRISINGVRESQAKLYKIIDKDEVEEVVFKRMIIAAGDARTICRDLKAVDTGRLMNSTGGTTTSNGPARVSSPAIEPDSAEAPPPKPGVIVTGRIGTNVSYAPFVHDGTRRMHPRPFIDMAMIRNMKPLQDDLNQYLERKSKEADKK